MIGAHGEQVPEYSGPRRRRTPGRRWLAVALAVIVVAGAVIFGVLQLVSPGGRPCQRAFVPAYFLPGNWGPAVRSKPAVMILDISGLGAGSAPEPSFQAAVRKAQAAGITVLGYSATQNGQRPAAEVEADAQHYKAWYGVTGIFLDQAAADTAQLGYYRTVTGYIRHLTPGADVWLNPGVYPAQGYMSVASVVMVFEGTYPQYQSAHVPGWVSRYPASKFAHTVYAVPAPQLAGVVKMSRERQAGYLYVTDRSGPNPYDGLPAYWHRETAAIAAGC
jgi:hypothetical protein